ncbi:MAG: helix-turn-helix domain-containing protein [Oligoflexia bacterium]|nr:helix-turn-helix domain-containing protein [Oligoflexia bacterium]
MSTNKNVNYYEILELPVDATRKEIIEAYQKTKSIYNKDSMALYTLYSDDESTRMLELIEEAYHVLINPHRRAVYDKENNISTSRSIVSIAFDRPGHMRRTFVETPNFKNYDNPEQDEKEQGKSQLSIQRNSPKSSYVESAPEYEIDDDLELRVSEEAEFEGAFFRRIREYKNMSLNFVSQKTKISLYHLEAIERENYSELPARVYVRGFINNYAKLLGLPVPKSVDAYMRRFDRVPK